MDQVKIVECPRDSWQGLPHVIPADVKVDYLERLMAAGLRHMDVVSFVSPKHVPQMADSEKVMEALVGAHGRAPLQDSLEIIGIVINEEGLARALATTGVTTLGYPYSVSAYFRRASANVSRSESRALVEKLQQATRAAGRNLVVYISMAFGNPYDEPWGPELIEDTLDWLKGIHVRQVSLADTLGTATPELVAELYRAVKDYVAGIELGVHLHSRPEDAVEKVLAAYEAGCRRFDCALTGLGDCPFAGDDLVGNIPTELAVEALARKGAGTGLLPEALSPALEFAKQLRKKYAYAVVH